MDIISENQENIEEILSELTFENHKLSDIKKAFENDKSPKKIVISKAQDKIIAYTPNYSKYCIIFSKPVKAIYHIK